MVKGQGWADKYLHSDHHQDRKAQDIVFYQKITGHQHPEPAAEVLRPKYRQQVNMTLGRGYEMENWDDDYSYGARKAYQISSAAADDSDAISYNSRVRDAHLLNDVTARLRNFGSNSDPYRRDVYERSGTRVSYPRTTAVPREGRTTTRGVLRAESPDRFRQYAPATSRYLKSHPQAMYTSATRRYDVSPVRDYRYTSTPGTATGFGGIGTFAHLAALRARVGSVPGSSDYSRTRRPASSYVHRPRYYSTSGPPDSLYYRSPLTYTSTYYQPGSLRYPYYDYDVSTPYHYGGAYSYGSDYPCYYSSLDAARGYGYLPRGYVTSMPSSVSAFKSDIGSFQHLLDVRSRQHDLPVSYGGTLYIPSSAPYYPGGYYDYVDRGLSYVHPTRRRAWSLPRIIAGNRFHVRRRRTSLPPYLGHRHYDYRMSPSTLVSLAKAAALTGRGQRELGVTGYSDVSVDPYYSEPRPAPVSYHYRPRQSSVPPVHVPSSSRYAEIEARLETMVPLDDVPSSSFQELRNKTTLVKNKMDAHKTLLDRYLPVPMGPHNEVEYEVQSKYGEIACRIPALDPHNAYASYYNPTSQVDITPTKSRVPDYTPPPPFKAVMSDTRQRLRDAICKGRQDRHYFD